MTLTLAPIVLSLAAVAALSIGLTAGWLQTPGSLTCGVRGIIRRLEIALPTIIVAGVVDSIDPCAFTLLLLFITALLATVGSAGPDAVLLARRPMLLNGGAFIFAIISLLALQESFAVSHGYLLIYNVMFILPLVAILMARWNLHHLDGIKIGLGGGVVVLGLAILATA